MKNLALLVPAMIVAMGASLTACGGSSISEESTPPVSEGQFIESYAAAICNNIGACCEDSGDAYEPDKCRALLETELRDLLPQSGNSAVSYDEALAGKCIAAVASFAKSCGGASDMDTSCERVYVGKLAEGETCKSDLECLAPAGGSASCDTADDTGARKCVVTPRGGPGDACGMTCTDEGSSMSCSGGGSIQGNAICYTNDGLYCGDNGLCTQLKAVGETCSYEGCERSAYCDESGVCAPRKSVGESCTGWDDCVDGANCMDDGVCGKPKPNGAACTSSIECEEECENGVCAADGFVGPAICSGTVDEY